MREEIDIQHIIKSPHQKAYEEFLQISVKNPSPEKGLYKYLKAAFPLSVEKIHQLWRKVSIFSRDEKKKKFLDNDEIFKLTGEGKTFAYKEIRDLNDNSLIVPAGGAIDQEACEKIRKININYAKGKNKNLESMTLLFPPDDREENLALSDFLKGIIDRRETFIPQAYPRL